MLRVLGALCNTRHDESMDQLHGTRSEGGGMGGLWTGNVGILPSTVLGPRIIFARR